MDSGSGLARRSIGYSFLVRRGFCLGWVVKMDVVVGSMSVDVGGRWVGGTYGRRLCRPF